MPEMQNSGYSELALHTPRRLAMAVAAAELMTLAAGGWAVYDAQTASAASCAEQECGSLALKHLLQADLAPAPAAPHGTELLPVKPYLHLDKLAVASAKPVKKVAPKPSPADIHLPVNTPKPAAAKGPAFRPLAIRKTEGADGSFPQCPEVTRGAKAGTWTIRNLEAEGFVLVGVTDYRQSDSMNPCLAQELSWAQSVGFRGVYANPMNPGNLKDPKAFGYSQAEHVVQRFIAAAQAAGVPAAPNKYEWWLDVETGNKWQGSTADNRAVVMGWAQYLRSIGSKLGVYSTTRQLTQIAGSFSAGNAGELQGADSWIPLGECSDQPLIPGGRVAMTQTVRERNGHDYDFDTAC